MIALQVFIIQTSSSVSLLEYAVENPTPPCSASPIVDVAGLHLPFSGHQDHMANSGSHLLAAV